jgi:hypothetical protein
MEHPLPQSYASHPVYGPWSPYQGHVVDYAAGDSYLAAHYVQANGEHNSGYEVCAAITAYQPLVPILTLHRLAPTI